ncbi:MAG TPA: extracellular solute-binding protein, partial [Candidatus Coproplasma excrementipullorum]|nr:extracellular solute-binding protein [Candidatus Coproplasma excrementipullorum]
MKKFKRMMCVGAAISLAACSTLTLFGCSAESDVITLRVANWEEYIDLGDWGEDEFIDIDNEYSEDGGVFGENSMVDDFVEWFNANHDYEVEVEYSTFGTNEDLYNRLSLGDVYDLVCPSDYMIEKLLNEGELEPYSETFLDTSIEENYYVNNASTYITDIFDNYMDGSGKTWNGYAACYMWGTTGIVYNTDKVDEAAVSTWEILRDTDYNRQVTIKDNVRDAYFATLGIIHGDELREGVSDERRSDLLNDTSDETIAAAEDMLKEIKENVYSFETDSGKADMVTGKVLANYQWSGDAVYIMDEAEGDELNPTELWYSVPNECTNLWFDGWV